MSYGQCNDCKKFGTLKCPTSSKCMKYEERPYFEQKEVTVKKYFDKVTWIVGILFSVVGH